MATTKVNNNIDIEALEADLIAKMNASFEAKQEKREMNSIKLGGRIVTKRIALGSPIIDKTTGEQKVFNGVPQTYTDKYYVVIQFVGAEFETELKDVITYDSLEEDKMYFCEGRLGEVKNFGSSILAPIITKFSKI